MDYKELLKKGNLYQYKKDFNEAIKYYRLALNKPQNGSVTKKMVSELIKECEDENNKGTDTNKQGIIEA